MQKENNLIEVDENKDDVLEKPTLFNKIKGFLNIHGFKFIIFIFVLIIIFSTFYYFIIYPIQQQNKIENNHLKEKCENESLKIFNNTQRNIKDTKYSYKNHYINSLNRCYILINGVSITGTGKSDKLIDVFNNELIANCESFTTAPDSNFCLYHDSKELKYDIEQFNNFIKPYMETK